MSIPNRRLQEVTERILREELQKGNLPSSKEFAWRLSEYLRDQDIRRPEYVFKAVYEGTKAVSGSYNDGLERIHRDLSILYRNMDEVMGLIGKKYSAFDLERERLEQEIHRIETRIKEKVLLYAEGGFLAAVYDVFDDLSKVDQSQTRGVIIDTKMKETRLSEELGRSSLISAPEKVSFSVLENVRQQKMEVSGPLNNTFSFERDHVFQTLVQTEEDIPLTGRLEAVYAEPVRMNEIEINLLGGGEDQVIVMTSPNGVDFEALPYHENGIKTKGQAIFRFPSIRVRSIRIDIQKSRSEEARPSDGFPYRYLFGFKEIRMRKASHLSEGVLQSIPLAIEGPKNYVANRVSLDVEEVIPDGCDIRYEIALNEPEAEWRRISPIGRENPSATQIIDFQLLGRSEATTIGLPAGMSKNQAERPEWAANGISFYELGKVSGRRVVESSERLYKGKDRWEMRGFQHDFGEGHTPGIEDWKNPMGSLSYEYPEMGVGRESMLMEGKKAAGVWNFMARAGFFREEKSVSVRVPVVSTETVTIYVNGSKVFSGNEGQMNIQLEEGWNEVIVCVYARNISTVNGSTVDTGIQTREWFTERYTSTKAMKKVPLFDLRYNTRIEERDVYSVVEGESGYEVVVNHGEPGLEYDLYYDYAMPMDSLEGKEVLLRATFLRPDDEETPSPVLKRYRIQLA